MICQNLKREFSEFKIVISCCMLISKPWIRGTDRLYHIVYLSPFQMRVPVVSDSLVHQSIPLLEVKLRQGKYFPTKNNRIAAFTVQNSFVLSFQTRDQGKFLYPVLPIHNDKVSDGILHSNTRTRVDPNLYSWSGVMSVASTYPLRLHSQNQSHIFYF